MGSSDVETVSATDEGRLPPGGFSLRHGFPQWFVQARNTASASKLPPGTDRSHSEDLLRTPLTGRRITIIEVLLYILETFSDERILDSIPVEAAANSGAYLAWRAYRAGVAPATQLPQEASISATLPLAPSTSAHVATSSHIRGPGQWNWEGVWEDRVKKALKASLSESMLYGGVVGEDIIRFRYDDEETVKRIKQQLEESFGGS